MQVLDSGVVGSSNVLAVITILNHVLGLGCQTVMSTFLAGLGSPGGINSHRLDRGLGHRTVLGVSFGVVNALGHRPGADHGRCAHSCLDKGRWIWDLDCASLGDCDALLANLGDCGLWLLAFASFTVAQLKAGVTKTNGFLTCGIPWCKLVRCNSSWNSLGPAKEAFSIGQSQTGAQEKHG